MALTDLIDKSLLSRAVEKILALFSDPNTNKPGVYYGTCSTAAATQAKTATITGITEYYSGLNVRLQFTNAQTYNGAPTLNINSLGAKNIGRYSGTNAARYEWLANEVLDLVYDGTRFVIVDAGIASTTYYGVTMLSSSTSSTSASLAATPSAVKAAYDLANGKASLNTSTTPVMDGTASIGSATTAALADHVHPSDTSKQDVLTFDSTPTSGSTNPVTSSGVYTALSGKQSTLTFDSAPASGSTNPVMSGGVYTAIANSAASATYSESTTYSSGTVGSALSSKRIYPVSLALTAFTDIESALSAGMLPIGTWNMSGSSGTYVLNVPYVRTEGSGSSRVYVFETYHTVNSVLTLYRFWVDTSDEWDYTTSQSLLSTLGLAYTTVTS